MIQEIKMRFGPHGSENPETLNPKALTILIGPNGGGKSRALREFYKAFTSGEKAKSVIAASVAFAPPGDANLASFNSSYLTKSDKPDHIKIDFDSEKRGTLRNEVPEQTFLKAIKSPESDEVSHRFFAEWFLHPLALYMDCTSRLSTLRVQSALVLKSKPRGLLNKLAFYDDRRAKVQSTIYEAFGKYLVLDPTGLSGLTVRFAQKKPTPQIERSFTNEAIEFFNDTEPIDEQSDGVLAFSSIIAQLIAEDPSLLLIDEPEAFLHPMLSQRLGSFLAAWAQKEQKQVFAATHSAAFLMGCVLSGVPVTVVRLTHSLESSTCRVLPHDELQVVMRDPLLRSIGVLDALFHTSAVMCESDGDRAVYQEINSRLLAENTGLKEAVFLNGGGKSTLYRTIRLLRRIGVPCAGIVDADVVYLGGADWTKLTEAIEIPSATALGLGVTKGKLKEALTKKGLKPSATGFVGLDPEDTEAAKEFCRQLAYFGLFVVPNGGLESWLKYLNVPFSDGAPKMDWVAKLFEKLGSDPKSADYQNPRPDDIWEFLRSVNEWTLKQSGPH